MTSQYHFFACGDKIGDESARKVVDLHKQLFIIVQISYDVLSYGKCAKVLES